MWRVLNGLVEFLDFRHQRYRGKERQSAQRRLVLELSLCSGVRPTIKLSVLGSNCAGTASLSGTLRSSTGPRTTSMLNLLSQSVSHPLLLVSLSTLPTFFPVSICKSCSPQK